MLALLFAPPRANAMPIFAQRYHLTCDTCHTVLPELNSFGNSFREHGYRLPVDEHGTTGIAIRYQLEYERDPVGSSRRFTPGAVVLAAPEIGALNAFFHYNLGAGGGPSGFFLAYVSRYNQHADTLYRVGLLEFPLLQSPGQRLDDLQQYGYYGLHVGLNDLPLASPRWGIQAQKHLGKAVLDVILDDGEFKGAAYGGKPLPTGEWSMPDRPEGALFARYALNDEWTIAAGALGGQRRITPTGRADFLDAYGREMLGITANIHKINFQAEQWWGNDADADGFGGGIASSGGYVRLKYYPTPHFYLAARYDAAAAPFITRDVVFYAAAHVTPHARLLIEHRQPMGGARAGTFGAALTVGFPWPSKL